jgi:hypothetical protein
MRYQRHARISALVGMVGTLLALLCLVLGSAIAESPAARSQQSITTIASTVPANGDVNPYGIVVVPNTVGNLVKGNLLISNFNAVSNEQGTGTTIMQISPGGTVSQFAQIDASILPGTCTGGIGLTTALVALRAGWVIVGSLPTSDGTSATAQAGCLLVLDPMGNVSETIYGTLINGPWDMAAFDHSNVNGGGTARHQRTERHRRGRRQRCESRHGSSSRSHPFEVSPSICRSDDRNWLWIRRAYRSGSIGDRPDWSGLKR